MGSLVLELQREALDSKTSVTDLLRKALVVARKLGIREFEEWVNSELDGYTRGLSVPKYREVRGDLQCWNPSRGWVDFFLDVELAKLLTVLPLGQPVGSIERVLLNGRQNYAIYYEKSIETQLMDMQEYPALRPALLIDPSVLIRIIDSVRNVVLNWTLKLEEDGILGEDMSFTKEEKKAATSSPVYHVQNFIGSMSHSQIQQDTRDSSQTMMSNSLDTAKVLLVLEEIKRILASLHLPPETKDELSAEIATAETQAKSPKPKSKIIKESLQTIRTILEGASGSLVANELPSLLEQLKTLIFGG